jgi:hypothetical protein
MKKIARVVAVQLALLLCTVAVARAQGTIKFKGGGHDQLKLHGKMVTPVPVGDLTATEVQFLLENDNGLIWHGTLQPGDLQGGKVVKFQDPTAKIGTGIRDGIASAKVRQAHPNDYRLYLTAYTDLSAATTAHMTITFFLGPYEALNTSDWIQKPYGWKLPPLPKAP